MYNLVGYVKNELKTFEEKPFSEVDSLVLSQMCYAYFDSFVAGLNELHRPIKLREMYRAEYFPVLFKGWCDTDSDRQLLFAAAASPRFRDIGLNFCVDELDHDKQKQFSAITFFLDPHTAYIAFRGTDTTWTGWKENFNMAFRSPVPAQIHAAEYLNAVASITRRKRVALIVGGHSKGGNLAVYAATMCHPRVQDRIKAVYSHDGPGFVPEFFDAGNYAAIASRVFKTIPQSSLVGMLLEDHEHYTVIKSEATGFMQHSPFTWAINGDKFIKLESVTGAAQYLDKTLNTWINSLSTSEREAFCEALYKILSDANITPSAIFEGKIIDKLPSLFAGYKELSPEIRTMLKKTLMSLAAISLKTASNMSKK